MRPDLELMGRTALITGGASGIGLATAELFLARGARVAIADASPDVETVALDLARRNGGECLGYPLDVRSTLHIDAVVHRVATAFGGVDMLVNVAGIYPARRVVELDDAFADTMMDINFHGVLRMCRATLPGMLDRGSGSIINISSGAASRPYAGLATYGASKAAVVAFSRALALEVAPRVRVNVVAPGATATPTVEAALSQGDNEGADAAVRGIPLGRLARPGEIAEAIAFFASDRAAYITGQTLAVNGGSSML
ncbi:3-oxoacyl-ACP reductase FabG [soil metagenome]